MADDVPGISFEKRSTARAYFFLPDAARDELRSFLLGQLLLLPGPAVPGKAKKVLAGGHFEWLPGYTVHWDVVLNPRESAYSVVRPSAYQIVVLEIETP